MEPSNDRPEMPNVAQLSAGARVLFYLPVVTGWWFEEVVFPLITALSKAHEVHVMAPPEWRNTGLSRAQAPLIEQADGVFWHLLDGPNHRQLRIDASEDDALIEFVERLAPDLVLCRSADIKTPARFPGIVRHLMEGGAPPLKNGVNRIRLAETLFDYGMMPELSAQENARLDAIGAQLWADQIDPLERSLPTRAQFLAETGLPPDRPIIALPLEYEHAENFFNQHLPIPNNPAMIAAIAAQIPADAVLAVTNHPLNELYCNNIAVHAAIAAQDDRVVLLESGPVQGRRTTELARHCDGMIVCNSKSWAPCAAFGKPLLRLSAFQTGSWVGAYDKLPEFLSDVLSGHGRQPDQALARRWFAFHFANEVFAPTDPDLSAADIIARVSRPIRPDTWDAVIADYRAQFTPELA